MLVHIALFSVFRDKLPPEKKGRTVLDLPEGSSVADVLAVLGITIHANVSLNGKIESDVNTLLKEGDELMFFRSIGGGSD